VRALYTQNNAKGRFLKVLPGWRIAQVADVLLLARLLIAGPCGCAVDSARPARCLSIKRSNGVIASRSLSQGFFLIETQILVHVHFTCIQVKDAVAEMLAIGTLALLGFSAQRVAQPAARSHARRSMVRASSRIPSVSRSAGAAPAAGYSRAYAIPSRADVAHTHPPHDMLLCSAVGT
jgi:hypothetical protein